MFTKRLISVIALVAILMTSFAAVKAQGGDTLVDVAVKNGSFKTLVAAVEAAGLVDTLKGAGPFTVFAPTDEAFAKVPPMVLEYLLMPENKELLAKILTYHVVPGKVLAADVATMTSATTVEGSDVTIIAGEAGVKVNSANVVITDVEASNGVIHVIDNVILPAITLPEVDPLAVKGNILTAGSSTVFPVSRAVADLFRNEGFADNIEVASVGTGAGFERFCKAGETDIANASRAIKGSETEECTKIERDPFGFFVGVDALAVVVGKETSYVTNLSKADLAKVFSGEAKTWQEVNPEWPADEIKLFSPGTDSGTFDYFVEIIFEKKKDPILNAPGIQFSEDDNVLVQGVAGTKGAIGYFGYAYFAPNADKLNVISVEDVAPSLESAESGKYPLSRPLFIYTTAKIMQEKPQVAAFVNYYLTVSNDLYGTEEGKIGYFPVNSDALNLNKLAFLALTAAK